MDYDVLRFIHDLSENDKFFIVGGYEGHVSTIISNKYNPEIFIFEPSKKWHDFLVEKHKDNEKIKVYPYGFGDDDSIRKLYIHGTGDGSSLFIDSTEYENVEIKKMSSFMDENNLGPIKMVEFNCEGAEFEIIQDLYKMDKIRLFEIIQIQYHRIPGYESLYGESVDILSKTHRRIWGSFIWECWIKY
jgi:FkbM family methyltransferase